MTALAPAADRPTLSAAMIVRDEERRLSTCLQSITPIVSEIVIVDTGSADRSIEIARSFGAAVHERPWQDDFSLHRNQSIDLCNGDWILVIDGDEVLEDAGDLCEVIARHHGDPGVDAVAVHVQAHGDRGPTERMMALRAVRRSIARYEHPVHNQLAGVRSTASSTAVIRSHYEGALAAKVERALRLLHRMLEQDPESAHATYFLAKTWWAAGDLGQTLHWAERCREILDDRSGYAGYWIWLFYASLALRGPDAAEEILREAIRRHPCFPALRHCEIAMATLRWNQAAGREGLYAFVAQDSHRFFPNLPEAARLLGLPLSFENRPITEPPEAAAAQSASLPQVSGAHRQKPRLSDLRVRACSTGEPPAAESARTPRDDAGFRPLTRAECGAREH